jgi:hypothetical protein
MIHNASAATSTLIAVPTGPLLFAVTADYTDTLGGDHAAASRPSDP